MISALIKMIAENPNPWSLVFATIAVGLVAVIGNAMRRPLMRQAIATQQKAAEAATEIKTFEAQRQTYESLINNLRADNMQLRSRESIHDAYEERLIAQIQNLQEENLRLRSQR